MRASLLALTLVACEKRQPTVVTPPPPAPSVVSSASVTALPPPPPPAPALEGKPFEVLAVPGFGDAVVSKPLGTTRKRPVVLALHGNYDRPEWQCETWGSILATRSLSAFVLCTRGVKRPDSPSPTDIRFTYASGASMKAELEAARAALIARWPAFVDDGPAVYTGFSLGAIYGVPWILEDPARTPRVVLTEGGHDPWTGPTIAKFAKKGGLRVLFACGQSSCVHTANPIAAAIGKAVGAKVVHGKNVGHGYDGAVADAIAEQLDWLVEGDERFAP